MAQSIRLQTQLRNRTTGVGSQSTVDYTSNEDNYLSDSQEVDAVPAALNLGSILNPRFYQLRLLSGDDVRISLDGGTSYPLRLSGVNDVQTLRPNFEEFREISQVVAEADVGGASDGRFFDLADVDGPVRVWLDVDEQGNAPAVPGGGRLVRAAIVTGAAAADVAAAIVAGFSGDAGLDASLSGATVTLTDKFPGVRTDIADGDTGWASFSTTQQGATLPQVFVQSVGESQLLATIAPN